MYTGCSTITTNDQGWTEQTQMVGVDEGLLRLPLRRQDNLGTETHVLELSAIS